uniref:Protein TIC 20 n=1 Tax=Chlamydomonas euryale TaxID=1486919 RepID=A0A7R9VIB5_9CHLO|mmetsp:Transcript_36488/g.107763  ORF Transcript_36488/g.107763 Transcript_36488/m.107763 type:complete len:219 (+) Transcript_36488:78-734(+)
MLCRSAGARTSCSQPHGPLAASAATSAVRHGHALQLRSIAAPQLQGGRRRSAAMAPVAAMNDGGPGVGDRVAATVPYILPMLDGVSFGKFLFMSYPPLARALSPLAPLSVLYNSVPFLPLIIFIGVYAGVVNNQNLSRFVRYNAAQAVCLDVLLIVPQVILSNFAPSDELSLSAFMTAYNTIFVFVLVSITYAMGSSLVGSVGRIPIVAEAADSQVRF